MNISISQQQQQQQQQKKKKKKEKHPKIYELLPLFSTNKEKEKKKKWLVRDKVGIENVEIRVIK